jgi:hypothetical protein
VARPGRWVVPAAPVGRVVESSEQRFGRPVFALSLDPDDVVLRGELADEPERGFRQSPDFRRIRPENTWSGTDGARGGR